MPLPLVAAGTAILTTGLRLLPWLGRAAVAAGRPLLGVAASAGRAVFGAVLKPALTILGIGGGIAAAPRVIGAVSSAGANNSQAAGEFSDAQAPGGENVSAKGIFAKLLAGAALIIAAIGDTLKGLWSSAHSLLRAMKETSPAQAAMAPISAPQDKQESVHQALRSEQGQSQAPAVARREIPRINYGGFVEPAIQISGGNKDIAAKRLASLLPVKGRDADVLCTLAVNGAISPSVFTQRVRQLAEQQGIAQHSDFPQIARNVLALHNGDPAAATQKFTEVMSHYSEDPDVQARVSEAAAKFYAGSMAEDHFDAEMASIAAEAPQQQDGLNNGQKQAPLQEAIADHMPQQQSAQQQEAQATPAPEPQPAMRI